MKKISFIFVVLICFTMISGSFATKSQTNNNIIMNGDAYKNLTIVLPSNPTTGYCWVAEYDHSQVNLIKKMFIPFNPQLIGSKGIEIFKFSGKKGAMIHMKYLKNWDLYSVTEERTYYIN